MRQTRDNIDPYRDIVEYYDLEHDDFRDDLPLIQQLVETVGDPVLELACGSGRILASLASEDRRLTGLDASRPMLDAARKRLQTSPGLIELSEGSMSDFDGGARYGVVVLALNGLLHATTSVDQRTVLESAHRALDPRGMLYLDIANPLVQWPGAGLQPLLAEGCWQTHDGAMVQKVASVTVDHASQRVSSDLWYDVNARDGALRRVATSYELRYLHAPEVELMLELAGFVEWQIYGSYELDRYTAESPRIIALAEKSPSG